MEGSALRRRRVAAVGVLIGAFVVAAVGAAKGLPGPLESGTAEATIMIEPEATGGTVSAGLFGANHRYPHDGFGSFTANGEPQARLVEEARDAGVTMLRYPGGTIANTFRWKRAVGPVDERGCQTGGGNGAPLDSAVGPDEHMAMVEQMGAGTTLVVNFATATPQEAADWVAYMNAPAGTSPWADLRAAHGHPEPYGVTWWEVGNEPDVFDQAYWMDQHPSMLPIDDPDRAKKYARGGTTRFEDQPLTTDCDRRKEAAASDGRAGQVRQVAYPPVADARLTVGGIEWSQVDSLNGAGPDDHVYTLDASSGRVEFGDGKRGAIPPQGDELRITYTSGPHAGYVDYVRAMKAVDPDINVCASYQGQVFVDEMGDDPLLDCQVSHPYTWLVVPMGAAQSHDNAMMGSDWQLVHVAEEQRALRQTTGREVPVLVSEYGLSPVPGFDTWQEPGGDYLRSLSPALYVASQLVGFAQLDLPIALKHSLVDLPPDDSGDSTSSNLGSRNVAIFGPGPDFRPSPTAEVLAMLSPLADHEVLATEIDDNPQRMTASGSYRALTSLAARSETGDLIVAVVNRDPERAVRTTLELGDSYRAVNADVLDGPAPDAVDGIKRTQRAVRLGDDSMTWSFPAHSVTVLTFSDPGAEVR